MADFARWLLAEHLPGILSGLAATGPGLAMIYHSLQANRGA